MDETFFVLIFGACYCHLLVSLQGRKFNTESDIIVALHVLIMNNILKNKKTMDVISCREYYRIFLNNKTSHYKHMDLWFRITFPEILLYLNSQLLYRRGSENTDYINQKCVWL